MASKRRTPAAKVSLLRYPAGAVAVRMTGRGPIMNTRVLLAGLILAFVAAPTLASEQGGLFTSQEVIAVTLSGPLDELLDDHDPDASEFPMVLTVGDRSFDVKVRQRGNFRRQTTTCRFPPLRLNFKKKSTSGTVFKGQDKLKLVTHCQERDTYQQNVYKEYVAYRILNLFSDASFRVRLLDINYVDTAGKRSTKRYGFLIEDIDALAKRVGAKEVKPVAIEPDELAQPAATLVSVYEYFVGNTDYSLIRAREGDNCCHNIKLIQYTPDLYTPVPYDYDMAGIVDAPYGVPDGRLGLHSVRDRLYRGFCTQRDTLDAVLRAFREKRDAIYGLMGEAGLMDNSTIRRTTKFFDGFYKILDSDSRVERVFVKGCR